jgi:hypothetical protein
MVGVWRRLCAVLIAIYILSLITDKSIARIVNGEGRQKNLATRSEVMQCLFARPLNGPSASFIGSVFRDASHTVLRARKLQQGAM